MILGHKIALDPTPEQSAYCRRACGIARYADNWGGLRVDQFALDWDRVRIPKVGWVRMRENVRLCGVVMGRHRVV